MTKVDDVSTALDDATALVTAHEAKRNATLAANTALIADLEAQLASGPPGLTEEQGNALLVKIRAITDAVAEPVVVPTSAAARKR